VSYGAPISTNKSRKKRVAPIEAGLRVFEETGDKEYARYVMDTEDALNRMQVTDDEGQFVDLSGAPRVIQEVGALAQRIDLSAQDEDALTHKEFNEQVRVIFEREAELAALGMVDLQGEFVDMTGESRTAREILKLAKRVRKSEKDKDSITYEEFREKVIKEQIEEKAVMALGMDPYKALKKIEFYYGSERVQRIIDLLAEKDLMASTTSQLTVEVILQAEQEDSENTSKAQLSREQANSPSVVGGWEKGSYEERQFAKNYANNSSKGESSDKDSDKD
jgi:hypothetical protein